MKISYDFKPPKNISYIDTFQKFLTEYGKLRYSKDNKKKLIVIHQNYYTSGLLFYRNRAKLKIFY